MPVACVHLFRFVSLSEQRDIQATGRLQIAPNSCEGKHFTDSLDHARQWGLILHSGRGAVVEVTISQEQFERLYFIGPKVDNIGPAYFADDSMLSHCKVEHVHA